mmetsp:Transcript_78836/g.255730  ORF Transcript_78836/g.255730 Transcript_78836/m.255730 type:complete len:454 (+) Transcript_78836:1-1362(+)
MLHVPASAQVEEAKECRLELGHFHHHPVETSTRDMAARPIALLLSALAAVPCAAEVAAAKEKDKQVYIVVLLPAGVMLVGSIAVFCVRVPAKLQAAFQNLSAGILISAVAGELYPLIVEPANDASPWKHYVALVAGFVIALLAMFGLGYLTGGAEDEEHEEQEEGEKQPNVKQVVDEEWGGKVSEIFSEKVDELMEEVDKLVVAVPIGSRDEIDKLVHTMMFVVDRAKRTLALPEPFDQASLKRMQFHADELRQNGESLKIATTTVGARKAIGIFEKTLAHIHGHTERMRFRRWSPAAQKDKVVEKISWPLVFAVFVDAAVDGLLVGLAFTASVGTGWCMSIATCIEMGFLGLSFCASVRNMTTSKLKQVVFVLGPSLVLAVFGILGDIIGTAMQSNPAVFVGFISFAIVALMFLVTQELLVESRETAGESISVNSCLFVGMLLGILLGAVLS